MMRYRFVAFWSGQQGSRPPGLAKIGFHMTLGKLLARNGKPGKVEIELARVLLLDLESAEAHFWHGTVLVRIGRPYEALADLSKAGQEPSLAGNLFS